MPPRSNGRITLYPGVDHQHVLRVLREAHTGVVNIRAKSTDPSKLSEHYLDWAEASVGALRHTVHPDDIDRLILTRRYWAIQASATGAPYNVVDNEIYERQAAFEQTITWLEETHGRWQHTPGRLVVADTSFFCQHTAKLADVDLAEVLELRDQPIRLMIPILVLDELEGLKQSSKAKTRWRAAHTLGFLDQILADDGIGLLRDEDLSPLASGESPRGRVHVEVFFDPSGHRRLPINDDELIDRALAIQAESTRQVTFLTYDTAQSTRARLTDLNVLKLAMDPGPEPEDDTRTR